VTITDVSEFRKSFFIFLFYGRSRHAGGAPGRSGGAAQPLDGGLHPPILAGLPGRLSPQLEGDDRLSTRRAPIRSRRLTLA
jgi:hypothetical protein